jgi:hypothetical protein
MKGCWRRARPLVEVTVDLAVVVGQQDGVAAGELGGIVPAADDRALVACLPDRLDVTVVEGVLELIEKGVAVHRAPRRGHRAPVVGEGGDVLDRVERVREQAGGGNHHVRADGLAVLLGDAPGPDGQLVRLGAGSAVLERDGRPRLVCLGESGDAAQNAFAIFRHRIRVELRLGPARPEQLRAVRDGSGHPAGIRRAGSGRNSSSDGIRPDECDQLAG